MRRTSRFGINNEVILLPISGEVLLFVIDDVIKPKALHHFQFLPCVDTRDLRSVSLVLSLQKDKMSHFYFQTDLITNC